MPAQERRLHWLDAVRGLAVVNMVAFHFLYDWCEVYARLPGWYALPAVQAEAMYNRSIHAHAAGGSIVVE